MTAPTLKKSLGEAGAFIDESNGSPSHLREALAALAKAGMPLTALQGTIAAAVLKSWVATFDGVIGDLSLVVGTTGSAGSTTVVVNKNGTALATAPAAVLNTDADGSTRSVDLSGDAEAGFVVGDVIDIEVTAAPTAGANLDVTVSLRPLVVE